MKRYVFLLCCLMMALPISLCASENGDTLYQSSTMKKLEAVIKHLPKISGYMQTGWHYDSQSEGSSTFQIKRLRLLMDGTINSKASFRLQIEAFSGTPGHTNGQKAMQVMDAYATYRFSEAIQVRAGQYNSPMCYENYNLSPATMETVDFSSLCSRMVFRNAISYDYPDFGRDLGVMIMGNLLPSENGFSHISYNVSLTNGNLPSINDNNKSKELQTILFYRPVKYINTKIAYSYGEYYGSRNIDGRRYQPMSRMIGGVWYDNPMGLDLRAEYAYATAKCRGRHIVKENAFYLLAAWHLGRFMPVLRYEFYRDGINKELVSANYDKFLAGISYNPWRNIKFQANYTLTRYTSPAKSANDGHAASSLVQLMGVFQF